MLRYMSAIAFAAGALSIAGSAQAQCSACELFPPINNTQTFTHAVLTNAVNVKVDGVHGDLKVSGTAVANNLSIDAGEGTTGTINNNQSFASYGTNISSTVNVGAKTAGLGDVGGALDVENTVVANNASIKLGACCTTAPTVNNVQTVSYDPTAIANVNLNTVGGDVDVANTAVANNLSIEGRVAQINNTQTSSWAPVNATANVNLGYAGANVNVSGSAIGNNLSWKLTPGS
ncbi:MAG: hypothetical protein CFE28_06055 [Alphaproteobacteria bacterium PA2]|nr:MAG: hypothetical protein CFE28_06055 [Alphaproteobacteria bacterium PA2]